MSDKEYAIETGLRVCKPLGDTDAKWTADDGSEVDVKEIVHPEAPEGKKAHDKVFLGWKVFYRVKNSDNVWKEIDDETESKGYYTNSLFAIDGNNSTRVLENNNTNVLFFVAQWGEKITDTTLTLHANNGVAETLDKGQVVFRANSGEEFKLPTLDEALPKADMTGKTDALSGRGFEKNIDGKKWYFKGWSPQKDGSILYYKPGESIRVDSVNATFFNHLYAIWDEGIHAELTKVWGEGVNKEAFKDYKVGLLRREAGITKDDGFYGFEIVKGSLRPLPQDDTKVSWDLPKVSEQGKKYVYVAVEVPGNKVDDFNSGNITGWEALNAVVPKEPVDGIITKEQHFGGDADAITSSTVRYDRVSDKGQDTLEFVMTNRKPTETKPPQVDRPAAGNDHINVLPPSDADTISVKLHDGTTVNVVKEGDNWYVATPEGKPDKQQPVKPDGDGKILVPVPADKVVQGEIIEVTAQDKAHHKDPSPVVSVTPDKADSGKVTNLEQGKGDDDSVVITGKGEPGTKITVYEPGTDNVIGTAVVDKEGNFTVELDKDRFTQGDAPLDPSKGVEVVQQGDGKNPSERESKTPIDVEAPPQPDVDTPVEGATSVTITPKDDTSTLVVRLPGLLGETRTYVKDADDHWYPADKDGKPDKGKGAVDKDGKVVVNDVPPLKPNQEVTVVAKDPYGNSAEPKRVETIDKTTSPEPKFDDPTAGDETVKVTPSPDADSITVKTPAGETHAVKVGEDWFKDSDGDGTPDTTKPKMEVKDKVVEVRVPEDKQNLIENGKPISVTVDDPYHSPSKPKTVVVGKATSQEADPKQEPSKDGKIVLSNNEKAPLPKDTVVTVTDPKTGNIIGSAKVGDDGKYTFEIPKDRMPEDGNVTITTTEPDKNPSKPKTVAVDNVGPDAPTIEAPSPTDTTVTVTPPKDGEPTKMVVKLPNGAEVTLEKGKDGNWTNTSKDPKAQKLTVDNGLEGKVVVHLPDGETVGDKGTVEATSYDAFENPSKDPSKAQAGERRNLGETGIDTMREGDNSTTLTPPEGADTLKVTFPNDKDPVTLKKVDDHWVFANKPDEQVPTKDGKLVVTAENPFDRNQTVTVEADDSTGAKKPSTTEKTVERRDKVDTPTLLPLEPGSTHIGVTPPANADRIEVTQPDGTKTILKKDANGDWYEYEFDGTDFNDKGVKVEKDPEGNLLVSTPRKDDGTATPLKTDDKVSVVAKNETDKLKDSDKDTGTVPVSTRQVDRPVFKEVKHTDPTFAIAPPKDPKAEDKTKAPADTLVVTFSKSGVDLQPDLILTKIGDKWMAPDGTEYTPDGEGFIHVNIPKDITLDSTYSISAIAKNEALDAIPSESSSVGVDLAKTAMPDAPEVSSPQENDTTVSVTPKEGTIKLVVTFPSGETTTLVKDGDDWKEADENGDPTGDPVDLANLPIKGNITEGNTITARGEDEYGNASKPGAGVVRGREATAMPSLSPIYQGATEIALMPPKDKDTGKDAADHMTVKIKDHEGKDIDTVNLVKDGDDWFVADPEGKPTGEALKHKDNDPEKPLLVAVPDDVELVPGTLVTATAEDRENNKKPSPEDIKIVQERQGKAATPKIAPVVANAPVIEITPVPSEDLLPDTLVVVISQPQALGEGGEAKELVETTINLVRVDDEWFIAEENGTPTGDALKVNDGKLQIPVPEGVTLKNDDSISATAERKHDLEYPQSMSDPTSVQVGAPQSNTPGGAQGKGDENTVVITGNGDPGSTITVYDPNGNPIGITTVNPDGGYTVDIPKDKVPTDGTVTVVQKTPDKGDSEPVPVELKTTPPSVGIGGPIYPDTPIVLTPSDDADTIVVEIPTNPDQPPVTLKRGPDGWTIDGPNDPAFGIVTSPDGKVVTLTPPEGVSLVPGGNVVVTVTDEYGNTPKEPTHEPVVEPVTPQVTPIEKYVGDPKVEVPEVGKHYTIPDGWVVTGDPIIPEYDPDLPGNYTIKVPAKRPDGKEVMVDVPLVVKKRNTGGGGGGGSIGRGGCMIPPIPGKGNEPAKPGDENFKPGLDDGVGVGEHGIHLRYVYGYPDYTFRPERNITRGEVAAIFSRILAPGKALTKTGKVFPDVPKDLWSGGNIEHLASLGVIGGYPDGTYRPEAPITRAEFASIVARMRELGVSTPEFNDALDHWAEGAIGAVAKAGYVTGYPDGTFRPDQEITRAEAVSITNHMLNRRADAAFVVNYLTDHHNYLDLNRNHWAYFEIYEAFFKHEFIRQKDMTERWVKILEEVY